MVHMMPVLRLYVPFIPGMSVLKFSIDGAPVCVKFADVLPPVQIVPFSGDEASGREKLP